MNYETEKYNLERELQKVKIEKFRILETASDIEITNINQRIRIIERKLDKLERIENFGKISYRF